ncbi:MAG: transcription-repair coupling factor, partial [Acetobacteraceae bacterium]|nr:transcription-repair coupling factor [Acetobacteraceae bacterium]
MTEAIQVWGAPEGWDAFLLARRRAEFPGAIVHVARDDARMARLAEALAFVMPEAEVLRFPAWDCLPYDRVSPNPALISERIATLARLLEKPDRPRIILTTVNALVQRVPPRSAFAGASMDLRVNGTVQPEKLAQFVESHGYGRAGTVMEPGEYAIRGGIIDIFPAGEADPVRLDLFGDTIESIRTFDPTTQRSAEKRQRLSLRPVSEVPLDKESIARFRTGWRDLFGQAAAEDPIYHSVSEGRRHPGMEHWVPLFHPTMENLLDYLSEASVSLDHQVEEVLKARLEMIADHFESRRGVARDGEVPYRPLPSGRLYLDRAEWDEMLSFGPLLAFSPFGKPDGAPGVEGGGRPGPVFAQGGLSSGGGPGINVFDQLRGQVERWS